MKIQNRTIVALTSICQKKISEVGAPLFIDCISRKLLLQKIIEYLVCGTFSVIWPLFADDGIESEFIIHIFMDGQITEIIAFTL